MASCFKNKINLPIELEASPIDMPVFACGQGVGLCPGCMYEQLMVLKSLIAGFYLAILVSDGKML